MQDPPALPTPGIGEFHDSRAGWWQLTPERSPIAFEAPACLPVRGAVGPRFSHPCRVKQFGQDGQLSRFERFDAAGRRVERSSWRAGVLVSRTLSLYAGGHEVRREEQQFQGTFVTEWTHDDRGRVLLERQGWLSAGDVLERRSHFDARERLALTEEDRVSRATGARERLSQSRYRYGARGLEAIETSPDDRVWALETAFTYHPNGQLQQSLRYTHPGDATHVEREEYDERGRLIASEKGSDAHGRSRTTYVHDARGLCVEERHRVEAGSGASERQLLFAYDAEGRLGARRLVEDAAFPESHPPLSLRQRVVHRFFHACGGDDLLFEEQDVNGDGERDGWREVVRDAAGNVRLERLGGTLADALPGLSRIEYEYDCHG